MKPRDWPTIKEVALELRAINANIEAEPSDLYKNCTRWTDIRLRPGPRGDGRRR